MKRKIEFHCKSEIQFSDENHLVSAFLYKDYIIPPHTHDFYEINIIFKGQGIHHIENASFSVKTGDVFVIPPMTDHSYSDTYNLDVYHILLHKDFILNNMKEATLVKGFLQFIEIEPFLRQNFSDAQFLHLTQKQLTQLKLDIEFIDEKSEFCTDEFLPLKNHTVWKILYTFSGMLAKQLYSNEKKCSDKVNHSILCALEHIHSHYCEKITIELLCKKAFLSRSSFLRKFYAVCGCSPISYLNNYRTKQALIMLEKGELTKTEIAHACGFYDLSHMERTMKRQKL